MPSPRRQHLLTVDEYLAREEREMCRNEYFDGQLFAMSGATRRHNIISVNLHAFIHQHLKGRPCRAYISDVKVRVEATNSFYYPDIMVACDEFTIYTTSPVLIVEVLSRSTAAIDRREKLFAYKQIPTLYEYLIVHQRKKRIEYHQKSSNGQWNVTTFGGGEFFTMLSEMGSPLTVAVDDIYEDVFTPESGNSSGARETVENGYLEDLELEWLDW